MKIEQHFYSRTHTHTHTFFDRINPFTSGCVLILWINEYHRIEILAECIGSNVQLDGGVEKKKKKKSIQTAFKSESVRYRHLRADVEN